MPFKAPLPNRSCHEQKSSNWHYACTASNPALCTLSLDGYMMKPTIRTLCDGYSMITIYY